MKYLVSAISPLLVAISLTLVGCGGDTTEESTKTESVEPTTQSENPGTGLSSSATANAYVSPLPDDAPTYNLAMIEYAPFKFRDEYGNDIGYDVDMIRAIGEEAGFKVTMTQVPFTKLFQKIQDNEYDLAMSGLSMLPERQALMASSEPYSKGRAGYMVQASFPNKDLAGLRDKRIAVLENSSLHKMLEKQGTAELVLKPTIFLSFQAIFDGQADASFNMEPTLFYQSDQFSEMPVEFIPFSEPVFTVVYAGKDKQDIITKVNEGLNKIKANGRYHKINEKWFDDHASDIEVD